MPSKPKTKKKAKGKRHPVLSQSETDAIYQIHYDWGRDNALKDMGIVCATRAYLDGYEAGSIERREALR